LKAILLKAISFGLLERTKCARDVLGISDLIISDLNYEERKGGVPTTRETFSKTISSGKMGRRKRQTAASQLKAAPQTTEKL